MKRLLVWLGLRKQWDAPVNPRQRKFPWVLVLLMLAGQALAVAPGTVALWNLELNGTDASGNGNNLTTVGSVPYPTSPVPPEGTTWAGPFTGNTIGFTTPAAVSAALWGKYYVYEFYIYMTGNSATQLWFESYGGAGNMWGGPETSRSMDWVCNGDTNFRTNGVCPLTTTTHYAYTWDGGNNKWYINGSLDRSAPAGSYACSWNNNGGSFNIGKSQLGAPLNQGYLKKVRFMSFSNANDVPTTFPISDAVVAIISAPLYLSPLAPARIKPYKPHR